MSNVPRLVVLLAACAAGCQRPTPPAPSNGPGLAERVDRAVAAGSRFLLGRQSADGAWSSDVYGQFKAGDALTPLALHALLTVHPEEELSDACRRGSAWLADLAPGKESAEDREPLIYPMYSAALAVRVLGDRRNRQHARARDRWLALLLQQQLAEENGWTPADPEFGGWGYSPHPPRKPGVGESRHALLAPNLSATAYAVDALRAADAPACRPALAAASRFVRRCQNHGGSDPAFDDGGFFFVPGEVERNKAGVAGVDSAGRQRFHSYGSATADGLRALLACGAPLDDPRVQAAKQWIERRAPGCAHPGTFARDSEAKRTGVYFYYCASLGAALTALGAEKANERLIEEMAEGLLEIQQEDGSWVSAHALVREDDPVVATSLALQALAAYRGRRGGP